MADAHTAIVDQDVLGLLVGALCHDIAHPGRTNTFEINSQSKRAMVYNDVSVLENHHAHTTFQILQKVSLCVLFADESLMFVRCVN